MEIKKLTDTKTGKTVYGIVSNGGCYGIYKSRRKAEQVAASTPIDTLKYYAQSVGGSVIYAYATGRYREVCL